MPPDPTLTITIAAATDQRPRTLRVQCAHGQTTLPLPQTADAVAERAATVLAVLQHDSATGCACTAGQPQGRHPGRPCWCPALNGRQDRSVTPS